MKQTDIVLDDQEKNSLFSLMSSSYYDEDNCNDLDELYRDLVNKLFATENGKKALLNIVNNRFSYCNDKALDAINGMIIIAIREQKKQYLNTAEITYLKKMISFSAEKTGNSEFRRTHMFSFDLIHYLSDNDKKEINNNYINTPLNKYDRGVLTGEIVTFFYLEEAMTRLLTFDRNYLFQYLNNNADNKNNEKIHNAVCIIIGSLESAENNTEKEILEKYLSYNYRNEEQDKKLKEADEELRKKQAEAAKHGGYCFSSSSTPLYSSKINDQIREKVNDLIVKYKNRDNI
jgi:hypothetical protein